MNWSVDLANTINILYAQASTANVTLSTDNVRATTLKNKPVGI
jgi:hypothetical protein